jgi:hypothetical protein
MRSTALFILGLVPALLAGCVAKTGSPDDSTKVGIHSYCAQTECVHECKLENDNECNDCTSGCYKLAEVGAESTTCFDACYEEYCDNPPDCIDQCSDQDSACADTEYKVVLPSTSNQSVLEGCQASNQNDKRCGPSGVFMSCKAASRMLTAQTGAAMACDSQQSCSATPATENCDWPAPSKIGDRFCSSCHNADECGNGFAPFLDEVDSWLVPSMHQALYSCLQASSCGDAWTCVNTFVNALYPGFYDPSSY